MGTEDGLDKGVYPCAEELQHCSCSEVCGKGAAGKINVDLYPPIKKQKIAK